MVMHKENPMKAQEWLERGDQRDDPVEMFSNYWRGFNNLFFGVCGGCECDKIKRFYRSKYFRR
jgi:hypothetical protein